MRGLHPGPLDNGVTDASASTQNPRDAISVSVKSQSPPWQGSGYLQDKVLAQTTEDIALAHGIGSSMDNNRL
jgi:hypothetical protein